MNGSKRICLWIIVIFALFLTACSQETDLFLRDQENWELITRLSLNLKALPDIGGDIEGINLNLNTGEIGKSGLAITLDQVVTYCQARGMESSWKTGRGKQRGETAYTLRIKGQGWNQLSSLSKPDLSLLNQLSPDLDISESWPFGISVTDLGNGQLKFDMDTVEDTSGLGFVFPVTFRLHGEKIISSNTAMVKGGEATWVNPSEKMEAVLTPASGFDVSISPTTGIVILAVILFIGLGFLAYLLLSRRPTRYSPRRATARRSPRYRR